MTGGNFTSDNNVNPDPGAVLFGLRSASLVIVGIIILTCVGSLIASCVAVCKKIFNSRNRNAGQVNQIEMQTADNGVADEPAPLPLYAEPITPAADAMVAPPYITSNESLVDLPRRNLCP
jgi:hypothetical protein